MKTSNISQTLQKSSQPQRWFDSGQDDIARMIERTIAPYVDHGNVSLQHDELQAESWFKVAKLMSSSSLDRCQTRQQFFAFIKVSLKNHVRTLVHKHAFTMKRTGIPVPTRVKISSWAEGKKTQYVRLDDPNELFQLAEDDTAAQTNALLVDFTNLLSTSERLLLRHIIESDDSFDPAVAKELRSRYKNFLQA